MQNLLKGNLVQKCFTSATMALNKTNSSILQHNGRKIMVKQKNNTHNDGDNCMHDEQEMIYDESPHNHNKIQRR